MVKVVQMFRHNRYRYWNGNRALNNKQNMKVKSVLSCLIVSLLLLNMAFAQQVKFKADKQLLQTINQDYKDADEQYKLMIKELEAGEFPKTFSASGKFETSNSGWWCSGFYPGTLLFLYNENKD